MNGKYNQNEFSAVGFSFSDRLLGLYGDPKLPASSSNIIILRLKSEFFFTVVNFCE